ncbi:50S ribosomal protein L16 arginine hydroxylase [Vibrio nigripulchritudo]|uniref:cupin domain-containing protein n=1 Tax=Vibrio nigripulchritudo TaxID=28173 RepID=UPI00190AE539|nr:cupin domain-containing protein [Vibrio nigripulchritudo]BCL69299.1 50S ribosomal protein L16 arginine hydroxylase [Vibrio nigripulchritudo]BDU30633.1 50S ribosomal protein L16 arginine hydroxylase [Vibrio nigripulchritudo]
MYQLSFSLEEFLTQYWQKKPTIIKGGFADFSDPLSPDELAGLTMEEEVDSRFVSNLDDNWVAEHGPFPEEKFAELGETNWSFIVQAANHWHPEAAELVKAFDAMPNWLFDDLMISYSVNGGGVGPHIDQYDVFIIQGLGKRHWRVGAKDEGQYTETCRHSVLRQIEGFDPIIDDVLEPGDILYIPPGFPHDGYALEPSMSYSVGYRSPKQQELLSNFADYVLVQDMGDHHLQNPQQETQESTGVIQSKDLDQLKSMLKNSLEDEDVLDKFIGCLVSQSRHQLDVVAMEEKWSSDELKAYLEDGGAIERVSGLRAYYHQEKPLTAYINGDVVTVEASQQAFITAMCDNQVMIWEDIVEAGDTETALDIMTDFVNRGYWFPQD